MISVRTEEIHFIFWLLFLLFMFYLPYHIRAYRRCYLHQCHIADITTAVLQCCSDRCGYVDQSSPRHLDEACDASSHHSDDELSPAIPSHPSASSRCQSRTCKDQNSSASTVSSIRIAACYIESYSRHHASVATSILRSNPALVSPR